MSLSSREPWHSTIGEASRQRGCITRALAEHASLLVCAGEAMAQRFSRGGKLVAFGNGRCATDAQHIAVEFIHPVIVGKPALPAISLSDDFAMLTDVGAARGLPEVFATPLGREALPSDIAIGVSAAGRCANVLRALEVAHEKGLLTIALTGGDGGEIGKSAAVDHCFIARCEDLRLVKEAHVPLYHILWEIVHVFLAQPAVHENPSRLEGGARGQARSRFSAEALYPFLNEGNPQPLGEGLRLSTSAKIEEIAQLRELVLEQQSERLFACARALAGSFANGGRLLAFGNGGSSTDAHAIAHTFSQAEVGRAVPAHSLTCNAAVVTALANDVGIAVIFARQIAALGRPNDVALGISTSGGSENVLRGFEEAHRRGLLSVGIAGYDGGRMAESEAIDFLLTVPSTSVHRIQEAQTTLYQVLFELTQGMLEERGTPPCAL
ncbi:MAG TPA: SIS domain-containing protein [Myxococcota bacterium]|nr:SIS domain-containing protein [Myxococcota bacterium]